MSLNRYAPKRDKNEGAIRKRFASHGWHTEQRSSAGGWDLDAYPPSPVVLGLTQVQHVDVKDGTGKVTAPQEKKWTALASIGIPVYVARTEEDVDAIVAGSATPWQSLGPRLAPGKGHVIKASAGYTPPRGPGVDASRQAAETFAPPPCQAKKQPCQRRRHKHPPEPKCERDGCGHLWSAHQHSEAVVPSAPSEPCAFNGCACPQYVGFSPAATVRSQ